MEAGKKASAIKTVGMMMVISLCGKVMGLFRDMLFGYNFGTTSIESSAFSIAGNLPRNFLDAVFASVITASFIPIFNEVYEKEGEKEAVKLSNSFISLILIASTLLVAVCIAFSGQLANIFAGGFDAQTKQLTAKLLRIMLPLIIFSGIAFCLTGILQCMGEFNIPAAMSIVSNGLIIFYYLFFVNKFGIFGVAWVFLLGWASQVLIQLPFLKKNGYKFKFIFDFNSFNNKHLKKIYKLMLPVMISTWAAPVNFMANATFATYAAEGSSAALSFSNSLFTIITGVFVLSVSNMIFPELSRLSVNEDKQLFGESLNTALRAVCFLLIPMSAGLMILSEPIVRMVYERGQFDSHSTYLTKTALTFYSAGVIGYGLQTILSRGFYALKDGRTPLYTALIAIIVNIAAGFLLLKPMGVGGVALASSISITTVGFILLFVMWKKNRYTLNKKTINDFFKMFACAALMSLGVYMLDAFLNGVLGRGTFAVAVSAACSAILGLMVYMFAAKALKIREADVFFNFLLKRK